MSYFTKITSVAKWKKSVSEKERGSRETSQEVCTMAQTRDNQEGSEDR